MYGMSSCLILEFSLYQTCDVLKTNTLLFNSSLKRWSSVTFKVLLYMGILFFFFLFLFIFFFYVFKKSN